MEIGPLNSSSSDSKARRLMEAFWMVWWMPIRAPIQAP